MNYQFHASSFETGMNQELLRLGDVTARTGTGNWRQGLGQFPPPLVDIKSIKYQQEMVEDDDKVIIG